MTLPNPSVLTRNHAEEGLTPDQLKDLHQREWERELAALDERIERLQAKEEKLKADTSLADTQAAVKETKAARRALHERGPA